MLEDEPGTTGSYTQDVKPNGGVKEKQGKMVVITKETGLHAGEPFRDAICPPLASHHQKQHFVSITELSQWVMHSVHISQGKSFQPEVGSTSHL